MIVPIDRWSRISEKALSFALSMSDDIRCVHVQIGEETDEFCTEWEKNIAGPLREARQMHSQADHPQVALPLRAAAGRGICPWRGERDRLHKVCVLVPELVVRHWWESLMHNRRADLLKVILLLRGNRRIIVINIPWYLDRG